ncbi:hypothetical protein E2C01_063113 [Portunus trituberculatus]|uniref:Uncharacterized protein n=1 Tax=Portunus trituberculatus TaxID=210409 RepID=A0A5B7HCU9_PORTR|nr:hypothetical protein [Portunus trituberculatus]
MNVTGNHRYPTMHYTNVNSDALVRQDINYNYLHSHADGPPPPDPPPPLPPPLVPPFFPTTLPCVPPSSFRPPHLAATPTFSKTYNFGGETNANTSDLQLIVCPGVCLSVRGTSSLCPLVQVCCDLLLVMVVVVVVVVVVVCSIYLSTCLLPYSALLAPLPFSPFILSYLHSLGVSPRCQLSLFRIPD